MMKHILVHILYFIPYGTVYFYNIFYKTWLWYNCRLAIISIDLNTVKVTGLILGYLSDKKSERTRSERETSSCKVKGHMIKKKCVRIIQGKKSRPCVQYEEEESV